IQRTSGYTVLQRHPIEKFHDDEKAAFLTTNFMDRANIWMVQGRSGTRLATETFERLRVLRQFIWQEFERHEAAELNLLGLEDHAHSAPTDLLDDAVVGDGLTNHWLRILRGAKHGSQQESNVALATR